MFNFSPLAVTLGKNFTSEPAFTLGVTRISLLNLANASLVSSGSSLTFSLLTSSSLSSISNEVVVDVLTCSAGLYVLHELINRQGYNVPNN